MKKKDRDAAYVARMDRRVRRLFSEIFPKRELVKLTVKSEEGWQGEDILEVRIAIGGGKRLDGDKMNELSTRAWLDDDVGEEDLGQDKYPFPVFYFTSAKAAKEEGVAF